MTSRFDTSEEFARKLDADDRLSRFREEFYIPDDSIYLLGNSLGLASSEAEENIKSELKRWKELGIEGWWKGDDDWFHLAEDLGEKLARLAGAEPEEVIATGTTTVNIHSLISTLYRPEGKRKKILADELNFPTDIYALQGQVKMKGMDPEEDLILVKSQDGHTLDEERIVKKMDESVSVALLPSVLYRSSQLLDMEYLTKEAHRNDILIGFDCSHSMGVIPHRFDDWGVDFAVWCSYKYLNGGPGSTAFLYLNSRHFDKEPLMRGWFGYVKEKQFELNVDFEHDRSAGGWQISSPAVLSASSLRGSLDIINEAGISEIRRKSKKMTSYLIYLADEILAEEPNGFEVISPRDPERRGGHVALKREGVDEIVEALKKEDIIVDGRPPDIMRLALSPLYNTYHEVWKTVHKIKKVMDERY